MSFSTQDTMVLYSGNGTTNTFAIPFAFERPEYISVYQIINATAPSTPAARPTILTLNRNTDWTLSGTDVIVTVPPPATDELLIVRSTDDIHDTLYNTYNFPFETVNFDLDRAYQLIQELREQLSRAVLDTPHNAASGETMLTMDDLRIMQQNIQTAIGGAGLPPGGAEGAVLTKQSALDGDGGWNQYAYTGYSVRFGQSFTSTDLDDTLAQILQLTYVGPLVSIAASGSGTVREKGATVASTTLTISVTRRTDPIDLVEFLDDGTPIGPATLNPPANTGTTTHVYVYSTPFSDNKTFGGRVTDDGTSGGPTTVTANVSFTFVYPYYSGAGAVGLSAAAVAALTKDIRVSTASLNKTFTAAAGQVYYFAYPASYGPLTSILDENGFQVIADWTLRTENITGLDGNPVSYRIYEFNNPVSGGTTNYTFTR